MMSTQCKALLAGTVTLGAVRVRLHAVTVEGFSLGNPPTAGRLTTAVH